VVSLGVAAAVFLAAYAGGSYGIGDWALAGLAAWWAVALVLAFDLGPVRRLSPAAWAALAALGGLTLLTLVSAEWADAPARAVTEFQRSLTYLGVFVLVLLLARHVSAARWSDGLALGIVAVAAVALVSRFLPDTFSTQGIPALLPAARARLSFPLGYWNGLAILVALAVPLLLRAAVAAVTPVGRAAGVAAFPAVAAVLLFTSSRGGVLTAVVGALVMLAVSRRRWAVAAASGVGAVATGATLAVILPLDDLVNHPLDGADASRQGVIAALAVPLVGVLAGAAWAFLYAAAPERSLVPRWAGTVAAVLGVVAVAAAIVLAHPVARIDAFKAAPEAAGGGEFVRSHLVSSGGSGRWQFWTAAADAFGTQPLHGRGAGSYEAWWTQHGSLAVFARNAHSQYLETAAELGILGLAALFVLLIAALAATLSQLDREDRETGAALAAAFWAFAVALAVDWIWQLPAVALVGVVLLALVVATGGGEEVEAEPYRPPWLGRIYGAIIAVVAALALAVPLLAERELVRSRDAVVAGDTAAAVEHAKRAGEIEPWSPEPALQLALVREAAGALPAARASLAEALERDPTDWRLWLIDARIRTKLADVAGARRSLARARELNPRSPLWRNRT
jgi:O-antigen ligase/polysaccharide polymerase Wzy-like membrane protein